MLYNYFKIAIRNLIRHKAFSFLNIAGLAVGIAAAFVLFLVINFELSFDNFHTKEDRIYRVVNEFNHAAGKDYQTGVPFPFGLALQTDYPQLEAITMVFSGYNNQLSVLDEKGNAVKKFKEETAVVFAQPSFFQIFDYQWLAGDASKALNQPQTVVLTRTAAIKYFGNWQKAIGKFIKLDNRVLLQVTGILKDMPTNTDFQKQVFVSYATIRQVLDAGEFTNWGSVWSDSQCYLVLPERTTTAAFNAFLVKFLQKHQPTDKNHTYLLQPLTQMHFSDRYPPPSFRSITHRTILFLGCIGAFILVIACINFVNLATAQAVGRAKEAGVRKVLGSSRRQLIGQFIGETFLLVLVAVLGALILVQLILPWIQPVSNLPANIKLAVTPPILLFLIIITLVVTFLAGFYPALIMSGFQPMQALKSKTAIQTVAGGLSLRKSLVVLQFSVSQILVISTLIVVSQMNFIRTKDLGFNQQAILLAEIPNDSLARINLQVLKNQLAALPAVQAVSFNSAAPSSDSNSNTNFRFADATRDEDFPLNIKFGDTAYFSTYQLRFSAGQGFLSNNAKQEVVVNETLLHKLGLNNPQEALGKQMQIFGKKYSVVGVVQDFHNVSLRQAIVPIAIVNDKESYRQVALKLAPANLQQTINQVEKIWSASYPDYVFEANLLDERIAQFYREENKLVQLFKIFAGVAIFISCLGLYGLISFLAVQKTKEIGIRKVLGASVTNIVALLSKDFLKLVLLANIIAWPLAWWVMHQWLQDFTYRVAIGWWLFGVAGLGALLLALLTVSMQAIKAAVANPVKSLRNE